MLNFALTNTCMTHINYIPWSFSRPLNNNVYINCIKAKILNENHLVVGLVVRAWDWDICSPVVSGSSLEIANIDDHLRLTWSLTSGSMRISWSARKLTRTLYVNKKKRSWMNNRRWKWSYLVNIIIRFYIYTFIYFLHNKLDSFWNTTWPLIFLGLTFLLSYNLIRIL